MNLMIQKYVSFYVIIDIGLLGCSCCPRLIFRPVSRIMTLVELSWNRCWYTVHPAEVPKTVTVSRDNAVSSPIWFCCMLSLLKCFSSQ